MAGVLSARGAGRRAPRSRLATATRRASLGAPLQSPRLNLARRRGRRDRPRCCSRPPRWRHRPRSTRRPTRRPDPRSPPTPHPRSRSSGSGPASWLGWLRLCRACRARRWRRLQSARALTNGGFAERVRSPMCPPPRCRCWRPPRRRRRRSQSRRTHPRRPQSRRGATPNRRTSGRAHAKQRVRVAGREGPRGAVSGMGALRGRE